MCKEKLGFIAIKLLMLLMLFGLVSCEDEIMDPISVKEDNQSFKFKNLSATDIEYNELIQNVLNDFKKENNTQNREKLSKTVDGEIFINENSGIYIEKNGVFSYSFQIIDTRNITDSNVLQNLVIYTTDFESWTTYSISYYFSSNDQLLVFLNGGDAVHTSMEVRLFDNQDWYLEKSHLDSRNTFGCSTIETITETYCRDKEDNVIVAPRDGGDLGGDCYGAIFTRPVTIVTIDAQCLTTVGSPSGGDGTGGDTNTNDPFNNPDTGDETINSTGSGGNLGGSSGGLNIPTSPVGTVDLGFVLDLGYNFSSPAFEYIGDDNGNYLARSFVTRNGGGSIAEDKLRNVLSVLISNESPDSLTTIEEHKLYIGIQTNYISNQHLDLEDLYEAYKPENIDPDGILGLTDYLRISQSALDIRNLATLGIGGNLAIRKTIIKHTILSSIKYIYENNLPQTAEEWEAVGSIVGSAILEIAPDLIPGVGEVRDALRGIEALDNGDYWAAAENISFAIAGIIPVGKLLKGIGKVGKAVYKSSKVIRALWGVLTEVGVALNRGFNVILESSQIFLKRNGDVIAQGDDAVINYVRVLDGATEFLTNPTAINNFSDEIIEINRRFSDGALLNGSPGSAINTALYQGTVIDQAASIFKSISRNHMFYNGNKRTAVEVFKSFASNSNIPVNLTDNQLLNIATEVALGFLDDVSQIGAALIK